MPREKKTAKAPTAKTLSAIENKCLEDAYQAPKTLPMEWRCVGRKVRVFWEREEEWNIGRVLQYDPHKGEHEIYYSESDCKKWTKLHSKIALIGLDIVWSKLGHFNWWPAQIYEPTSRCLQSKLFSTTSKGSLYVVFFGDDSQAWVRESFVCPFLSNMQHALPSEKRGGAKLKASIVAAEEENLCIYKVASPKCLSEKFWEVSFAVHSPESWIGREVMLTHPESKVESTATVKKYSPKSGLHLCAYSYPPDLRSSWVNLKNAGIRTKEEGIDIEHKGNPYFVKLRRKRKLSPNIQDSTTKHKKPSGQVGRPPRNVVKVEIDHCANCGKKNDEFTVICNICNVAMHIYCADPAVHPEAVQSLQNYKIRNNESSKFEGQERDWCCKMCKICSGCKKIDSSVGSLKKHKLSDIHFGYQTVPPLHKCTPWEAELNMPGSDGRPWMVKDELDECIELCPSCEVKYSNGNYCSLCNVTWKDENEEELQNEQDMKSMQCCKCYHWVHAFCDGVATDEEFKAITEDMHPLWSAPFDYVCPICRNMYHRKILRSLVEADKNGWFFHPVTADQAPSYLYKISRPMSLSVIASVVARGGYRSSQELREHCELIAENALIFNLRDDAIHKAAKDFFVACNTIWKTLEKEGIYTKPSECGLRIQERHVSSRRRSLNSQNDSSTRESGENELNTEYTVGTLVKCADPIELAGSDKSPSSFFVSSSDLFNNVWLDMCLFCGTCGDSKRLLCCKDCGEVFHPWCLGVPEASMDALAKASWQCYNCKSCEICCKVSSTDFSKLLLCERCDRAFHTTCVVPKINLPFESNFVCGQCIECSECGCDLNPTRYSTVRDKCLNCLKISADSVEDQNEREIKRRKAILLHEKRSQTFKGQLLSPQQWGCIVNTEELRGKCPCCLKYSAGSSIHCIRCQSCELYVHISCCEEARKAIDSFEKLANTGCSINSLNSSIHSGAKCVDEYFCSACLGRSTLLRTNTINQDNGGLINDQDDSFKSEGIPVQRKGDRKTCILDWNLKYPAHITRNNHGNENRASTHLGSGSACRKLINKLDYIQMKRMSLHEKGNANGSVELIRANQFYDAEIFVREKSRGYYEEVLSEALNRLVALGGWTKEQEINIFQESDETFQRASRFLRMMRMHGGRRSKLLLRYLVAKGYKIEFPAQKKNSYAFLFSNSIKCSKMPKELNSHFPILTVARLAKCADSFLKVTNKELNIDEETLTDTTISSPSHILSDNCLLLKPSINDDQSMPVTAPVSDTERKYCKFTEYESFINSNGNFENEHELKEKTDMSLRATCISDLSKCAWDIPSNIEDDSTAHDHQNADFGKRSKERIANLDIAAPKALRGWNEDIRFRTLKVKCHKWTDSRHCIMCHDSGDHTVGGALLPLENGTWIHTYCAAWSGGVVTSVDHPGLLLNVYNARINSRGTFCSLCHERGATLRCFHLKCLLTFHLPCAILAGAALCRDRRIFCAAHIDDTSIPHTKDELLQMPEMFYEVEKRKLQFTWMTDVALRVGALIVLSIGTVTELEGWFDISHVYPIGFKSIRIFWSISNPLLRTPYLCEILDGRTLSSSTSEKYEGILFRITSLEDPELIIIDRSIETTYVKLIQKLYHARKEVRCKDEWFLKERNNFQSYGLNGSQFFGVGLRNIRKVIESMPETIGAAAVPVSSKPVKSKDTEPKPCSGETRSKKRRLNDSNNSESIRYSFCMELPSKKAIENWNLRRIQKLHDREQISSTCARVEPHRDVSIRTKMVKISRSIMKALEEPEQALQAAGLHSTRGSKSSHRSCPVINSVSRQYKSLLESAQRSLTVRRSNIHGWGLFTDQPFSRDEMIVEYSGEIISKVESDIREKRYEELGMGSCYLFALDPTTIVDATCAGGPARFINHCCDPNAYARVIEVDKELKLVIFSKRNLAVGEEITYDYQFPYEDDRIPCRCGAMKCKGYMN